jgi:transcriptional regulator with XRE-family HTH domain
MEQSSFFAIVQRLCAQKGISVTALGEALNLSKATTSGWRKGSQPQAKTIKAIGEYFGVSVDYLMGSDGQQHIINDNHGVIGNTHAPLTIINGSEHQLSEQESEMLRIFTQLSVVQQAKVLVYASELKGKK